MFWAFFDQSAKGTEHARKRSERERERESLCHIGIGKPIYMKGYSCLFNITEDPCEYNNVVYKYPEIFEELVWELYNATLGKGGEFVEDPMVFPEPTFADPFNFGGYGRFFSFSLLLKIENNCIFFVWKSKRKRKKPVGHIGVHGMGRNGVGDYG